jgi:tetratricopeptide (TPR) repeat protein
MQADARVSQCKTQAARLFRAGDYASARAAYQRGIDSLNTDQGHVRTWKATCNTVAELHANIAACALKQRDFDAVLQSGQSALVAGGLDASKSVISTKLRAKIFYRIATALEAVGQLEAALQALDQVLQHSPENARAGDKLAALQLAWHGLALRSAPFGEQLAVVRPVDAGALVCAEIPLLIAAARKPGGPSGGGAVAQMMRLFTRRTTAFFDESLAQRARVLREAERFVAPLLGGELDELCGSAPPRGADATMTTLPSIAIAVRLAKAYAKRYPHRPISLRQLCALHALWSARGVQLEDGREALCAHIGAAIDVRRGGREETSRTAPSRAKQLPANAVLHMAMNDEDELTVCVVAQAMLAANDALRLDFAAAAAAAAVSSSSEVTSFNARGQWRSMKTSEGVLMLAHSLKGPSQLAAVHVLHRHYHRVHSTSTAPPPLELDCAIARLLLAHTLSEGGGGSPAAVAAAAARAVVEAANALSLSRSSAGKEKRSPPRFSDVLTTITRCAKLPRSIALVDKISLHRTVGALPPTSRFAATLQRAVPPALILESAAPDAEYAAWISSGDSGSSSDADDLLLVAAMGKPSESEPWFLKAPRANNGEGVEPLTSAAPAAFNAALRAVRTRLPSSAAGPLLLQRSPVAGVALLHGRKFDVRSFVLRTRGLSSSGRVGIFRDAIVYTAARQQRGGSEVDARLRHVSNAAVQAASTEAYEQSLSQYQLVASEALQAVGWASEVLPRITDVLRALFGVFAAAEDGGRGEKEREGGAVPLFDCELLGVDFLLSRETDAKALEVSLLEVNSLPRVGEGVHTPQIQRMVTAPMVNGIASVLAGGGVERSGWLPVELDEVDYTNVRREKT